MNLRTLGATLATLVKDNSEPQRIFTDLVNKVQEVIDVIETTTNEVLTGYEGAGGTWSDAIDPSQEPGADGTLGYHCQSCRMNDAPVADLDNVEKMNYIVDNHPKAAVRGWADKTLGIHDSDKDMDYLDFFIDKYFAEAREADNPSVWDHPGDENEA